MPDSGSSPDERPDERIDRLAQQVRTLRQEVQSLHDEVNALQANGVSHSAERASSVGKSRVASAWRASKQRVAQRLRTLSSENWTGRLGIGLLLAGLLFLFKYSVDQGWLAPAVRVSFGALLGGGLLTAGLRVYPTRSRLGGLLLGGSSATFYATVFAVYQLYALLPYPFAFACMAVCTLVTFGLAVRHDDAVLGVVGAAGALATPFLLYSDAGSLVGLVAYLLTVLAGMSGVYLYRGWRSLLYTLVAGGWLVLFVGGVDVALSWDDAALRDQIALQVGVVGAWLLLGGVPVVRALFQRLRPERWSKPPLPFAGRFVTWLEERPRYALVNTSPLLAMAATRLLWEDVPDATWGLVAAGGAILYGCAYVALARVPLSRYAPAHGIVAVLLLTYAFGELAGGAALLLAWSVEVVALHIVARRIEEPVLRWTGHALAAILALWMMIRLESPLPAETALLSGGPLSEVGVLVGLGLASFAVPGITAPRLYRVAVWAGWLAWTWSQFVDLPNGHAYVSALWGATALAMLVAGWQQGSAVVQRGALATLLLFVGKLILVDLAQLPALWRILLFLVSGGVLLLVSYALPDRRPARTASDAS